MNPIKEVIDLSRDWDWETFTNMLLDGLKKARNLDIFPNTISLSSEFINSCKEIRDRDPLRIEVGANIELDVYIRKLVLKRIQEGKEASIIIEDDPPSVDGIHIGSIHRHPAHHGDDTEDPLDFYLGIGSMWFSQCLDNEGDIYALLLSRETFSIVVYKNYLGIAIKTGKTPMYWKLHDNKPELARELQELQAQTADAHSRLANVSEKYGIMFYYTTDFETKPLKKI